jgi:GntR family transcriptional regulator
VVAPWQKADAPPGFTPGAARPPDLTTLHPGGHLDRKSHVCIRLPTYTDVDQRIGVATVNGVTVDHDSDQPVYQQIAQIIRRRIDAGEIPPRRRIPSEQDMVQEFGVARVTARRAVAWMREQGWVYTVPQRGTYVTPPGGDRRH